MPGIREIYEKILNISNKYLSGKPHIHVSSIASELDMDEQILSENINTLSNLRLIEFADGKKEFIILSDLRNNVLTDMATKTIPGINSNAA